jgi:hypothetical protein
VTHNKNDFSQPEGDHRQYHTDFADIFTKRKVRYFVTLKDALMTVDSSVIEDLESEEYWEQPRATDEIVDEIGVLIDKVWYNRHKVNRMGNPNDVWLCAFRTKRQSRTEIDTSLVFDTKQNKFQIRVSQDYETQAKIESSYSDVDAYLAAHKDDREMAMQAISDHLATNPKYKKEMRSALARIKSLG